uniref:Uncharacterized protein n=1 Tax=Oryza barthii TaxID=65489 RepID=A0A0D3HJ13_9ORYZ
MPTWLGIYALASVCSPLIDSSWRYSFAAHSRKSTVAVLMPLLMLLLTAMAASAASSYQPDDQMSDFGMCFFASSCYDTGCA